MHRTQYSVGLTLDRPNKIFVASNTQSLDTPHILCVAQCATLADLWCMYATAPWKNIVWAIQYLTMNGCMHTCVYRCVHVHVYIQTFLSSRSPDVWCLIHCLSELFAFTGERREVKRGEERGEDKRGPVNSLQVTKINAKCVRFTSQFSCS